jgi:hypothetical protein
MIKSNALNAHLESLLDLLIDTGREDSYDQFEQILLSIARKLQYDKHFWTVQPDEIVHRLLQLDLADEKNHEKIVEPERLVQKAQEEAAKDEQRKQLEAEVSQIKDLMKQYEPVDAYDPTCEIHEFLSKARSATLSGYSGYLARVVMPDLEKRIRLDNGEFSESVSLDVLWEMWHPRIEGTGTEKYYACSEERKKEARERNMIPEEWDAYLDLFKSFAQKDQSRQETSIGSIGSRGSRGRDAWGERSAGDGRGEEWELFHPPLKTNKPFSEYIAWRRDYLARRHELFQRLLASIK